jgi:hypothetical protein
MGSGGQLDPVGPPSILCVLEKLRWHAGHIAEAFEFSG